MTVHSADAPDERKYIQVHLHWKRIASIIASECAGGVSAVIVGTKDAPKWVQSIGK